ncbi:MAG: protein phosphatase 2C domain-containing protein [Chloroflexi bacterium]|nr:protein phosphatase 2C domain-containing protein [Chloroflexota bacterium]
MPLRPPTKFWLPKAGNRTDEYEDASRALYPQRIGTSGRGLARVAVTDGASDAAFAREWANVLVDAFVSRTPDLDGLSPESLSGWLEPAQDEWHDQVPWDRIPWHGEAKARAGAFATLLGLTIGASSPRTNRFSWQAMAIGDCCLFIVRDDRLQVSFPLEAHAEFDNNPALVCSNPTSVEGLWEEVRQDSGECVAGDLIIVATDAIAAWFLAQNAIEKKPWETLAELQSSVWDDWVAEQRREGLMRNDDTTVVIIEVS